MKIGIICNKKPAGVRGANAPWTHKGVTWIPNKPTYWLCSSYDVLIVMPDVKMPSDVYHALRFMVADRNGVVVGCGEGC